MKLYNFIEACKYWLEVIPDVLGINCLKWNSKQGFNMDIK